MIFTMEAPQIFKIITPQQKKQNCFQMGLSSHKPFPVFYFKGLNIAKEFLDEHGIFLIDSMAGKFCNTLLEGILCKKDVLLAF